MLKQPGRPIPHRKLIAHYLALHRPAAESEGAWYAASADLREAISRAALATNSSGRKHPHQWRVPPAALRRAEAQLLAVEEALAGAGSFEKLIQAVRDATGPIRGFGEMAEYDTAARLGHYLRVQPQQVYLHRGTRDGARNLGLRVRGRASLTMSELPAPVQTLSPGEAEDYLCIFKKVFKDPSQWPINKARCGWCGVRC